VLKFEHQQIMVDDVEGSGQVKQAERGNVPIVGSEQKVVIYNVGYISPAVTKYL